MKGLSYLALLNLQELQKKAHYYQIKVERNYTSLNITEYLLSLNITAYLFQYASIFFFNWKPFGKEKSLS